MAMRGEATNQFPRPNAWVWGRRGTGTDTNGRRRNWSLMGSLHKKKRKKQNRFLHSANDVLQPKTNYVAIWENELDKAKV